MRTSVVIVACREHRWLAPCIESVLRQSDEVIVVDNGSPSEWASRTARNLGARALRTSRNVGFPAGVNLGIRAARGDLIALLNDDAIAVDGWLASAARVLAEPDVAAVAPKLLLASPYAEVAFDDEPYFAPGDPRPLGRQLTKATVAGEDVLPALLGPGIHKLEELAAPDGRRRWRWTNGREPLYVPLADGAGPHDILLEGQPVTARRVVELVNNAGSYLSTEGHSGDYGFETPDGPAFSEPAERFAACGAAMVVRAETFARLGLLAGTFFAYYEDTDWCWRARLGGLRVVYDPQAVVRHVRGVSSGGPRDSRVRFLAARNRLHCLARNAPLPLLRWQFNRTAEPEQPEGLRQAAARRIPRGLIERRWLARRWKLSPAELFRLWAGRDEDWPRLSASGGDSP